jgi:hypothetical protein
MKKEEIKQHKVAYKVALGYKTKKYLKMNTNLP